MSPNTDRTVLEGPVAADQKLGRRVHFQSSDSSEDLRRAIELSLQEHPQLTCPSDPAVTPVAASCRPPATPTGSVRSRVAANEADHVKQRHSPGGVNPCERRENGWPAGLFNVGNSCWFNAVVQPLFHLPHFRHLLLHHRPFQQEEKTECPARQCILELQRVFALLQSSWRRHVDPSRAVQVLRAQFVGSGDQGVFCDPVAAGNCQQDVSEFLHKLLNWLEDSFQQQQQCEEGSVGESGGESSVGERSAGRNVMASLFYGQLTSERISEGRTASCVETFGQFPLTVSADTDLHSALEASMLSWHADTASGQWFSTLPPVLILQLSRFKFNQRLECTEKLHDRLSFPDRIFLDRYLYRNCRLVARKRAELALLRQERVLLQRRLDSFKSFGDSAPRLPLPCLLRHTLSYVRGDGIQRTAEAARPSVRSHLHSGAGLDDTHRTARLPSETSSSDASDLVFPAVLEDREGSLPPAKRSALGSCQELSVVERCLSRWIEEVESEMVSLKARLDQIDCQTATMFDDCALRKVPYRLHAVLVHEGQAVSGHYWAYVYNQQRQCWIKFNDVKVSASTWREVCADSAGGSGNTSAYCLIYYDAKRQDLFHEQYDTGGDSEESADSGDVSGFSSLLPDWLKQFVDEDNQLLLAEHTHQSPRQHNHLARASDAEELYSEVSDRCVSPDSEDPGLEGASGPGGPAVCGVLSGVSLDHAELQLNNSRLVLRSVSLAEAGLSAAQSLVKALRSEMTRVKQLCGVCVRGVDAILSGAESDPRLASFPVYLLCNLADIACFVQWALLEQMSHPELSTDSSVLALHRQAVRELRVFVEKRSPSERQQFSLWHTWYATFRRINWLVLQVLDHYSREQFDCAVQCSVQACRLSENLCRKREQFSTRLSVSPQLLLQLRRKSIQCLNQHQLHLFCSGSLRQLERQVEGVLVPAVGELAQSGELADRATAEQVKQTWLDLLDTEMDGKTQQIYQVILDGLVDPAPVVDDSLLKIRRVEKESELAEKLRLRLAQFKQLT